MGDSSHPGHSVLARRLHASLRWRNANARHPDALAANAANAPASAANDNNAWPAHAPRQRDQTGKRSWTPH